MPHGELAFGPEMKGPQKVTQGKRPSAPPWVEVTSGFAPPPASKSSDAAKCAPRAEERRRGAGVDPAPGNGGETRVSAN